MITIKNENVRPFDVDGTLIYRPTGDLTEKTVMIPDPIRPGWQLCFAVNENMVRLLMEEHYRGSHIVVHSRGGYEWAELVVDALGIRPYVHQCQSKPLAYFDDTPVELWLKDRVFIAPDEKYKR